MSQNEMIRVEVDPALEHIIPIFVEEMQEYVRAIANALDDGDFALIDDLGHTIKGTASNFRIAPLTEIGSSLESAML